MLGLLPVMSAGQLEQETRSRNERVQQQPLLTGLAQHVRSRWEAAKDAKVPHEERMLRSMRQRMGQYDPDKLAEIRKQGGSELFVHLTSTKCRAASGWLRDSLSGSGAEKPWELKPTPKPDLPPEVVLGLQQELSQQVQAYMQQTQQPPTPEMMQQAVEQMRAQMKSRLDEESRTRVESMERKMEDQLIEGGFSEALDAFIDDIVTYPIAVLKGPVLRRRKTLQWVNGSLQPQDVIKPEWERVSPFDLYPAPWATDPNDGYLIERHRLSRRDIESLIGVSGYDEDALRAVLYDFDGGGLREWLSVDTAIQDVQENETSHTRDTDLVDALQLWDDVPGKLLLDWGMSEEEVPDPTSVYSCEVWLVGNYVIKAVLNYDPMDRKPYFVASFEKSPGSFYGNSIPDIVRDVQIMCNAAARALANNMGIASGPQVGVNVSRIPPGEDITQMYPWKIWQFQTSDYGDNSPPIQFFQPQSNAQELLNVFEYYSKLADEYSGIPRYMTGAHTPGVGRTASGLSMLINNASKAIKQVIANVDRSVLTPLLERLYFHNMRYSQDPDLIGDANIVARGAMSLVTREAAAVRRNEFLQMALQNPVAQQILGIPGVAELLRESAKTLDMNVDKILPSREALEQQMLQQQMAQQQLMQQQMIQQQMAQQGVDSPSELQPDGTPAGGYDSNVMASRAP